jgi:hypothetical protein
MVAQRSNQLQASGLICCRRAVPAAEKGQLFIVVSKQTSEQEKERERESLFLLAGQKSISNRPFRMCFPRHDVCFPIKIRSFKADAVSPLSRDNNRGGSIPSVEITISGEIDPFWILE